MFPIKQPALTCGNSLRHHGTRPDIASPGRLQMPARSRPLNEADGPLARFAIELRRLRDQAPRGRPTSVAKVAAASSSAIGKATIYAALSGRTLPSRETLAAIVRGWSPQGEADLATWNERRTKCEADLARAGRSPATSTTIAGQRRPTGPHAFGPELRRAREATGMSLGEFAHRSTYSKGYLSKIENGYKPGNVSIARRADALLGTEGRLLTFLRHGADAHAS